MVDYYVMKELEKLGYRDIDVFLRDYWSLIPYEKQKILKEFYS